MGSVMLRDVVLHHTDTLSHSGHSASHIISHASGSFAFPDQYLPSGIFQDSGKLGPLEMHRAWCHFWPLNIPPCFLSLQIICLSKGIWEKCHQNRLSSLPSSVVATAQKEVSPVRASWDTRQQCSKGGRRTATIRNHILILDFTSYN